MCKVGRKERAEVSRDVDESREFEGLLYIMEWAYKVGVNLDWPIHAEVLSGYEGSVSCSWWRGLLQGGWSLSLPDNQYPTGLHATAKSCSYRTSFLILHEFRILG